MAKQKKRKKAGLPPGSLVFTGEQFVDTPEVTLLQFNPETFREEKQRNLLPPVREGAFVNWYDIRGLHNVALIEEIGRQYQIHPLVLEDVLDTQQRPKFEEFEGGVFLSLQAMRLDPEKDRIVTEQVAIYAGPGFTISFQEKEDDLFAPVRERLHSGRGKIRQRGGDYLMYALADAIVDQYYFLLDHLEEKIDLLEESILSEAHRRSKADIHQLKLVALTLRKSVSPLREAINRFSKSDSPVVQETTQLFCRDLYDHTIQVIDTIDTYRDIINGLYDLYLSEISLRMNSVMQTLTIISTIFIPLTFLAGIYGMNFEHMPELHWRYSYFVLWGIMVATALVLLFLFRRRGWL